MTKLSDLNSLDDFQYGNIFSIESGDGFVLTLINSNGQQVEIVKVEPNSKQIQMDLASYKPGIYFVLFTDPLEKHIIKRLKVIKIQ